jgi:hypothetical protein
MKQVNEYKVYVPVEVRFNEEGQMLPHIIVWEGKKYKVDKVTDIRPAHAMKAGGMGDRYTIWIGGQQSYIFFERLSNVTGCSLGRWFVEKKTA